MSGSLRTILRGIGAFIACLVAVAGGLIAGATPAAANGCTESFSGGGGNSASDPYIITTPSDLTALHGDDRCWDNHYYRQTADLDMSGEPQWTGATDGHGLGTYASAFTGGYDGAGFRISGLSITTPTSGTNVAVGLFGHIAAGTTIANVDFTGDVTAGDANSVLLFLGGLVGWNEGTVTGSSAHGAVEAGSITGGFGPTISVGGLVGEQKNTAVLVSSQASGTVVAGSSSGWATVYAGGLVGRANGSGVSQSFSTSRVEAGDSNGGLLAVGGLAGGAAGLSDVYASGTVSAGNGSSGILVVGGLVGSVSDLTRGYATGSVSAGASAVIGGLMGNDNSGAGSIQNSFWDIQTAGTAVGVGSGALGGVLGRTTAQMQDITTFLGASWPISAEWPSGATWGICSDSGYPYLSWQFTANPCAQSFDMSTQFTYWLPDGRECTSISPQPVTLGEMVALPGPEADCLEQSRAPGVVAGWTVPGGVTFAPGRRLLVTDSQQFTAVNVYEWVRVTYDSNVGLGDACVVGGTDTMTRTMERWYPRSLWTDGSGPALSAASPCAPNGYELDGWTDRRTDTALQIGESVPGPAVDANGDAANDIRLYAVWRLT